MMNSQIFNKCFFPDWAKTIHTEIREAREIEPNWYSPAGWYVTKDGRLDPNPDRSKPAVFDTSLMHFINENLNIKYLEGMAHCALTENYVYSPLFKKSLDFCNDVRTTINEHGPFGRMLVWNVLPNGIIAPHVDTLPYQLCVTRYIFCVSDHSGSDVSIRINDEYVDVKQGLMFAFDAAAEHEFINKTDRDWNFLGIDYWDPLKLKEICEQHNITHDTIIEYTPGPGRGPGMDKVKLWS